MKFEQLTRFARGFVYAYNGNLALRIQISESLIVYMNKFGSNAVLISLARIGKNGRNSNRHP